MKTWGLSAQYDDDIGITNIISRNEDIQYLYLYHIPQIRIIKECIFQRTFGWGIYTVATDTHNTIDGEIMYANRTKKCNENIRVILKMKR